MIERVKLTNNDGMAVNFDSFQSNTQLVSQNKDFYFNNDEGLIIKLDISKKQVTIRDSIKDLIER
jgi:hypothetical protein